jgi:hypothetical protein
LQKQQRRRKVIHKIDPVNISEPLIKIRKEDEPVGKEKLFLAVRFEHEQDHPSDEAKIKPRLSDLIRERWMMRRTCRDQRGN